MQTNKITSYELRQMGVIDLKAFVRKRLALDINTNLFRHVDRDKLAQEHLRFDMSGYELETGQHTIDTMAIVNKFADLGIYDYTQYLYLDFYKGTPTLFLKYFYDAKGEVIDLTGAGTVDIIIDIFDRTIFSGKQRRRRD